MAATVGRADRPLSSRSTSPTVRLWWPRGYGEQPLYARRDAAAGDAALDTLVGGGSASATCAWTPRPTSTARVRPARQRQSGLRPRGELDPRRLLPVTASPRRAMPTRLDQAVEAEHQPAARLGRRHLRERTTSTTCATSSGLLVWQDFLFACAAYPEEEPLRGEVDAEAREHVTRLSPHPSLVLWNGNNENIWGYEDWGWQEQLRRPHLGTGYYTDVLPAIVGRAGPDAAVLRRAARTRSTRRAPSQRPGPRHHAHLGRLEPARLHRLPRLPAAVRRRVRLPGAARLVDADPRDRTTCPLHAGLARRCCCTRRRTTATPSSRAGCTPHLPPPELRRLALGDIARTRPGP